MPNINVRIEGMAKLAEHADFLESGQRKFLDRIVVRIARAIEETSPKGHIPFHGDAVSATTGKIFSTHPGAKALDKGAYITPHGHPKLRFQVEGRTVFAKSVRLKARNYVRKGLRQRNRIVAEEYERYFGNLG